MFYINNYLPMLNVQPLLYQAFWYPHLLLGGGGRVGPAGSPAISETVVPMKFGKVLETSLNILEMLKLLT